MSTPPTVPIPPQAPPPAAVRPLAKGTLGRRLVLRVAALVALVAVGLITVVALGVYNIQINQMDGRLAVPARVPVPASAARRSGRSSPARRAI